MREQPERFPPPVTKFIAEGFWDWKRGRSDRGLVATIQAKLDAQQQQQQAGGKTFALTNISLKALPQEMSRGEYTRQQMAKPTNKVGPETEAEAAEQGALGPGRRTRTDASLAAERYSRDRAKKKEDPPRRAAEKPGAHDEEDCLDECCIVS